MVLCVPLQTRVTSSTWLVCSSVAGEMSVLVFLVPIETSGEAIMRFNVVEFLIAVADTTTALRH